MTTDQHVLGSVKFKKNAMDSYGEHVADRKCHCKPVAVYVGLGVMEVRHK